MRNVPDSLQQLTILHSETSNLLFFHHPSKKLSCQYLVLRTMQDVLHHKLLSPFLLHIDDTYNGDNDDEEKEKAGDTQSRGVD